MMPYGGPSRRRRSQDTQTSGTPHDQQHDYQAWIDNDHRIRELLTRLEALGAAAADPRWKR